MFTMFLIGITGLGPGPAYVAPATTEARVVQMPSSVSESAPWLAAGSYEAVVDATVGHSEPGEAVGSTGASGSGTVP